jgi:hypothetical protein
MARLVIPIPVYPILTPGPSRIITVLLQYQMAPVYGTGTMVYTYSQWYMHVLTILHANGALATEAADKYPMKANADSL